MSVLDIDFGLELKKANEEGFQEGYQLGTVHGMNACTDEEFKAEAKRRGYKLIKITPKPKTIKLLQCQCGRKRITRWMYPNRFRDEYSEDYIRYVCEACGITAAGDKDDRVARLNWNKMIEEEMKDESGTV